MKRFVISVVFVLFIAVSAAAADQHKEEHGALFEIKRDGKIGFINKSGKEVVPPRFDDVRGKFIEGMARIQVNDLWGFINKNGTVVVAPDYEDADDFFEGLARVRSKKKWGWAISPAARRG